MEGGARYDPVLDAWFPLPTDQAPAPRFGHSVLSTGESLIFWGGIDVDRWVLSDGAVLDL